MKYFSVPFSHMFKMGINMIISKHFTENRLPIFFSPVSLLTYSVMQVFEAIYIWWLPFSVVTYILVKAWYDTKNKAQMKI